MRRTFFLIRFVVGAASGVATSVGGRSGQIPKVQNCGGFIKLVVVINVSRNLFTID